MDPKLLFQPEALFDKHRRALTAYAGDMLDKTKALRRITCGDPQNAVDEYKRISSEHGLSLTSQTYAEEENEKSYQITMTTRNASVTLSWISDDGYEDELATIESQFEKQLEILSGAQLEESSPQEAARLKMLAFDLEEKNLQKETGLIYHGIDPVMQRVLGSIDPLDLRVRTRGSSVMGAGRDTITLQDFQEEWLEENLLNINGITREYEQQTRNRFKLSSDSEETVRISFKKSKALVCAGMLIGDVKWNRKTLETHMTRPPETVMESIPGQAISKLTNMPLVKDAGLRAVTAEHDEQKLLIHTDALSANIRIISEKLR